MFYDLLDQFRGDAQRNGPASQALREMLASSQLRSWSEEEAPPEEGLRLLLLVATYSRYDLELLDTLNKRMESPQEVVRRDVASINDFKPGGIRAGFAGHRPGPGRTRVGCVAGWGSDGALMGLAAKTRVLELVKP
ncbi:MAG: hypothetical protein JNK87_28935 [Bryobacterales bacterium]|nr:hypothetical protein [Bryobacterales bacterium]